MPKGYIAIDGTSLTVGEVFERSFTVYLCPKMSVGDSVNLEVEAKTKAIVDTVEKVLARWEAFLGPGWAAEHQRKHSNLWALCVHRDTMGRQPQQQRARQQQRRRPSRQLRRIWLRPSGASGTAGRTGAARSDPATAAGAGFPTSDTLVSAAAPGSVGNSSHDSTRSCEGCGGGSADGAPPLNAWTSTALHQRRAASDSP
jgi:hypothetical protein